MYLGPGHITLSFCCRSRDCHSADTSNVVCVIGTLGRQNLCTHCTCVSPHVIKSRVGDIYCPNSTLTLIVHLAQPMYWTFKDLSMYLWVGNMQTESTTGNGLVLHWVPLPTERTWISCGGGGGLQSAIGNRVAQLQISHWELSYIQMSIVNPLVVQSVHQGAGLSAALHWAILHISSSMSILINSLGSFGTGCCVRKPPLPPLNPCNHPNTMADGDFSPGVMDLHSLLQHHVHRIMDDIILSPALQGREFNSEKLQKPR